MRDPKAARSSQAAVEELIASLPSVRILLREGHLRQQLVDDLGLALRGA